MENQNFSWTAAIGYRIPQAHLILYTLKDMYIQNTNTCVRFFWQLQRKL